MISKYYEFSRLAVASYAIFAESLEEPVEALGNGANMTFTQAKGFLKEYDVIQHYPNDSVGFSATIFQNKATGKLYFAIRGTEIPSDIVPDLLVSDILQIGPEGYAKSQAASLYRYWRKVTTAGGETVNYSSLEISQLYAISRGLSGLNSIDPNAIDYLGFRADLLADKGIQGVQPVGTPLVAPDAVVNVAGHSLGGHLSMLFARFFPENTGEVVTLNAPGFFTNSSLLTTLGFPPPENNKITRLEADGDGISELGAPGFWPGTKIAIAQENEPGAVAAISTNHSSVNGNDALALMRVIALLDSRLDRDIATLSDLIRAASTEPGSSYEELLDGFRTLVLGKGLAATRRTTGTDSVEREPYYKHLQELEAAITDGQLLNAVTIESLTNLTAEDLIGQAHSSLAYRYALVEANPFVVLGRESLYERHNQQGELELYDPVTGTGKLTTEWLTARADLLSRQIQAALVDRALAQDPLIRFGTDDSEELTVGYSNEGSGGSLFGGDGDDLLSGLSGRDYLEGGDGRDQLQGRAGADTLRGMAGEDVLTGGEGNDYLEGGLDGDTYRFVKGDGFDRIVDVHGLNQIVIDGLPLTAVRQVVPGSNTYLSEDERVRLVLTDADKGTRHLLIEYGQNDRILIEDYRAEAFGLKLEDYQEPEAAAEPELNSLPGDLKPVDIDASAEGEQVDYDQWGNVRVTDTRDADREDRLFDTDGNDDLQGQGGSDSLRGTHGGHDRLLYADLGDIVLDGLSVDQVADISQSPCCLDLRTEINSLGAAA